ncbi:MAG: hypothetical protein ACJ74O_15105 [Frankiaceae bacterium]
MSVVDVAEVNAVAAVSDVRSVAEEFTAFFDASRGRRAQSPDRPPHRAHELEQRLWRASCQAPLSS